MWQTKGGSAKWKQSHLEDNLPRPDFEHDAKGRTDAQCMTLVAGLMKATRTASWPLRLQRLEELAMKKGGKFPCSGMVGAHTKSES